MYKGKSKPHKTSISRKGVIVEGESIEAKVRRIMRTREPITDGAPDIFTDRESGVAPEHNIRTDRFELALDMMEKAGQAAAEAAAKGQEHHDLGEPGEGKEVPKKGSPKSKDTDKE